MKLLLVLDMLAQVGALFGGLWCAYPLRRFDCAAACFAFGAFCVAWDTRAKLLDRWERKPSKRPRWKVIPANFWQDTAGRVFEVDTADRARQMPDPPPLKPRRPVSDSKPRRAKP